MGLIGQALNQQYANLNAGQANQFAQQAMYDPYAAAQNAVLQTQMGLPPWLAAQADQARTYGGSRDAAALGASSPVLLLLKPG
jgi:hypothetical protein